MKFTIGFHQNKQQFELLNRVDALYVRSEDDTPFDPEEIAETIFEKHVNYGVGKDNKQRLKSLNKEEKILLTRLAEVQFLKKAVTRKKIKAEFK
jgi:hypothetical protein